MECVKSADILKPAKSAAKGLMAVISGDKGGSGYVRQMIVSDCVVLVSRCVYCFQYNVRDTGSNPCWLRLVLGLGPRLGTVLIKLTVLLCCLDSLDLNI